MRDSLLGGACVHGGRNIDSLGVKYTTASAKDKLFRVMERNILKVLLSYEAPVNLPFCERTGAPPKLLSATPAPGKSYNGRSK